MGGYVVNYQGAVHQVDDRPRADWRGEPEPSVLEELLASGKGFRLATPTEARLWWRAQGLEPPAELKGA